MPTHVEAEKPQKDENFMVSHSMVRAVIGFRELLINSTLKLFILVNSIRLFVGSAEEILKNN